MVAVRNADDNVSTEKHAYHFCALTEDISEEERAGVTDHLRILA